MTTIDAMTEVTQPQEPSRGCLPLDNVRILDFSRLLPGPWCTQMLADMGADVIKIEQPGSGDPGRYNAPNFRHGSVYFASVNRGKRSLALDLGRPEGREVVLRLMADADVVVESFRRGVVDRLGIDYASARAANPGVIYCSITGFGQTGPLAPIPGHDLVVQAMTGLMGTSAESAAAPPGFQAADYAGASYAVMGILGALLRRGSSGEGCQLDISMFDSLFSMCNIVLTGPMADAAGHAPQDGMEVWGRNPRYTTYPTADGKHVAVSLLEARTWERFCVVMGRPDLVDADEDLKQRHSTHGARSAAYRDAIGAYCLTRSRDDLVHELLRSDIPICSVATPGEALETEQAVERGLVEWIDHPSEGRIPQLGNPLSRSGLADTQRRPAPALGQDGAAILDDIGYSPTERDALLRSGVVA